MKNKMRILIYVIIIILLFSSIVTGDNEKIESGDVIEIIVYGQEALSRIVTVKPKGTVDFPFLQNIPVDGLTLNELREIIVIQLSKYMDQKPLVSVIQLDIYPINVTVLGQVVRPGTYQIEVNSTIQGAIGQAGGLLPGANLALIKIIRKDRITNKKQTSTINLEDFLVSGDIESLPNIEDGDIIVIPSYSGSSTVKVLGEVNRPGTFEINFSNDSILDLIFMAGGLTKDANFSKVKLISPHLQEKKEIVLNLHDNFNTSEYQQIPDVKPGDVIFVPKKAFFWRKLISVIRDLTVFATLWVLYERGNDYK